MAGLLLQQGRLQLAACSPQRGTACHGCLQPARGLRQSQRQTRLVVCCKAKSRSDTSEQQWSPAFQRGVVCLLAENLWHPQLALADSIQYDPSQGSDAIKYVFGAAYILGAALFFWKVFGRRAKRFRQERYAKSVEQQDDAGIDIAGQDAKTKATPLTAMFGALQAAGLCWLLFQACQGVDAYFAKQALSDQRTIHNITVAMRTIVSGMTYLGTFICGANALGLTGLAIQLAVDPASLEEPQRVPTKKSDQT
ncbi:hypothetical protein WJX74_004163 [Apatococcus lobatus]|uniref:Uncharacterized protein n=1 Tax=Apatococcus lobatus TaxID=904363 RepID=A0AAW1S2B2_9CHLO